MTDDEKINLFQRGVEVGKEHQTMSQETEKAIGEMRDEWTDTKKFVRMVALAVGAALLGYGVWVGSIETRVDDFKDRILINERAAEELRGKIQTAEVANAGVQQKLTNIEATLLEIRSALKIK